jgi:hypothetical protein
MFVTERSYAGFLRTQYGTPFRNLIPGVGITNTTPQTEFWVTLYVPEPFSKEK